MAIGSMLRYIPNEVSVKNVFFLILHQTSGFSVFRSFKNAPKSGRGSIKKYFRIFLRPIEKMKSIKIKVR
jgi:hypothetical protein